MFARRGDGRGEASEDIFLGQLVNEAAVPFFRYQIAAIFVFTFFQDVRDTLKAASQGNEHILGIGRGGTSVLFFRLCGKHGRFCRKRRTERLAHLVFDVLLTAHALNFCAIGCDLGFHLVVSRSVFSAKQSVFVSMGFQKSLCSLPGLGTFVQKFSNRHGRCPP